MGDVNSESERAETILNDGINKYFHLFCGSYGLSSVNCHTVQVRKKSTAKHLYFRISKYIWQAYDFTKFFTFDFGHTDVQAKWQQPREIKQLTN
jgi:hypothetical protein